MSKRPTSKSNKDDPMAMLQAAMPAVLAWNMYRSMQDGFEKKDRPREPEERSRKVKRRASEEDVQPSRNLNNAIAEKLEELFRQQRALQELHIKSALAAKKREEELKEKLIQLEGQVKKDREMMILICKRFPNIKIPDDPFDKSKDIEDHLEAGDGDEDEEGEEQDEDNQEEEEDGDDDVVETDEVDED